jgi:hypothetical protein
MSQVSDQRAALHLKVQSDQSWHNIAVNHTIIDDLLG